MCLMSDVLRSTLNVELLMLDIKRTRHASRSKKRSILGVNNNSLSAECRYLNVAQRGKEKQKRREEEQNVANH